jgi:imidazolonepropionase-like amidohydrolase
MATLRIALAAALAAVQTLAAQARSRAPSDSTFLIHAATMLDGRGGTTRDPLLLVRAGKIERVVSGPLALEPPAGARVIELGNATLLPGMIDAHTHPGWYVDGSGKLQTGMREGAVALAAQARNLKATLLAGFTTVQSLGGVEDLALRSGTASDSIPGPRLLTSIQQLSDPGPTPDSFRVLVRALEQRGADVIKLFASSGLGSADPQLLSDEQIRAICSEAHAQGLRSLVHAMTAQSVRASTLAGCTQIEHGLFATDAELRLMAERGTFFDPQVCLVFQNYLDRPQIYDFDPAALALFREALAVARRTFQHALATPGLKIVFGTDAVAGSHGLNADELVCRAQAGQKPMDVIVSATSLAATALGMGDHLGVIAPGYDADIIATDGNPAVDIEATKRVVFVMRAGRVYK